MILRGTGQALREAQPTPNAPVSGSHVLVQNLEFSLPLPFWPQDVLESKQLQQTFAKHVLQRPGHFQGSVMVTKEMQGTKMNVQGHPRPRGASAHLVHVLLPANIP